MTQIQPPKKVIVQNPIKEKPKKQIKNHTALERKQKGSTITAKNPDDEELNELVDCLYKVITTLRMKELEDSNEIENNQVEM